MVAYIFPSNFSTTTTITVFIIFFIWSASNGYAYDYDKCSSTWSCGKVTNIGFPFSWHGRPFYCGHPALQLQCLHDQSNDYFPVLQIDDPDVGYLSFKVLAIWNTNSSFTTIKLLHMQPQSEIQHQSACPIDFIKYGVSAKYLFKYSSNVGLALFMGCSEPVHNNKTLSSDSVTCSDVDGHPVWAYYLHNQSDSRGPDGSEYEGCNGVQDLQVPVLKEELNKFQQGKETLEVVFSKGFEVELDIKYSQACINCLLSGGDCGPRSSDQQLVCTCKNRNYTNVCPSSGKWRLRLILGLGSLGGGVLILIGLVVCYINIRPTRKFAIFSRGRGAQHQNVEAFLKIYGSLAPKRYTYANIRKMTNHFKDKLGEGGYATVFKGKLQNDHLVAVKLLKQVKGNGDDFISEVASIGRTNHVNIVSLLGFCFEGKKTALIYEFMSNGSLERFTYRGASYMSLSWETLFDIALGIARGLDYLHRGCNARILHFDIKPHNILLDNEFHPKISDFGLARLCPQQESSISMLEARGTIGYIAPEVFCRNFGCVSHKSDVYSYGMMILDLVCGRTNTSAEAHHSSEIYFPQWIYNRLELGEDNIVPGSLNDEEKGLQRKMILVSLWCIQTYPSNRPSMGRVTEMLNGCLELIPMPPKPYISSPPRLTFHTSETPRTT